MTTSCGSDRSTRCSTSAGSGTGTIVSPLPSTQRVRKSGTVRPAGEKKSIVGRVPRTCLLAEGSSAPKLRTPPPACPSLEGFCLVDQHDGDVVFDGIDQPAGVA